MSTLLFLAGWAIRSAILILAGAIVLRASHVKDPSVRLAVWTMILLGSLATPVLTRELPVAPVVMSRAAVVPAPAMPPSDGHAVPAGVPMRQGERPMPFDWTRALIAVYAVVLSALLLRLCIAWAMSLRLLGRSRVTGQPGEDLEIRESDEVTSPVALGMLHPVILIPGDWRQWSSAKLNAVVAHERAHLRRHDPAVQTLSAIHRALVWFSPFSWMLHQCLVRAAEDASDDSAMSAIGDRAVYAEVLLDFMRRGAPGSSWVAVPMASHGRPEARIHRILEGTTLSRGVTRWRLAGILATGLPVICLVAAAKPQSVAQAPSVEQPAPAVVTAPPKVKKSVPVAAPRAGLAYLPGLGAVTPLNTVHVKSRVDGLLKSVDFKEGAPVHEGDVLANVEPGQIQAKQAEIRETEALIGGTELQLKQAIRDNDFGTVEQLKYRLASEKAELSATMAQYPANVPIRSPINGLAGLRMIDPGNTVRADDATIVTVTQVQPIGVLFGIPEDSLAVVRERLRAGAAPVVEAWNRDNTARIAMGRLTAIDNQIDPDTGMAKLKAEFANDDGALFPNQFVNVRLFLVNHNYYAH